MKLLYNAFLHGPGPDLLRIVLECVYVISIKCSACVPVIYVRIVLVRFEKVLRIY